MKEKKNVSKIKLNSKKLGIFILFLLLLAYTTYTFVSQHIKLSQREKIATEVLEEINDANLEHEQLEKELENANSPEYLEKMAREKLGLVKPNERIFVDVTKD